MAEKTILAYLETGRKKCSLCNEEKSNSEFYKKGGKNSKKGHLRSRCKECMHLSKKDKENLEENRIKYREDKKKRTSEYRKRQLHLMKNYQKTDEYKLIQRDRMLKHKYGISLEEYDNMVKDQNGKCYICGIDYKSLCVDHDHKTGKVRKLLCDPCNITLGTVKEKVSTLEKMIDYIKNHNKTCGTCDIFCGNDWCSSLDAD